MIDLAEFNISPENSSIKCVFLSDTTCVGKTSILKYLLEEEFDEYYSTTIGLEYFQVKYEVKNTDVQEIIHLYDTSGAKEYSAINFMYLKDAAAIVFVYDITNGESFKSLEIYIKEVKKEAEKVAEGCLFFLLGNKLDLIEQKQNPKERQVTIDEAKNFAESNDLIFLGECSAKENTYMPGSDEVLYCKEKKLIEKDGKCTEGLHGMLKNIIRRVHYLV